MMKLFMKNLGTVAMCLSLFFLDYAVYAANGSAAKEMKVVTVSKDKSFSSQIIYENAIYQLPYSYDLQGKSIKVPNGSVLKFSGGRLGNGSIDLNNCYIVAESMGFFSGNLNISGKTMSPCYADWFEGSDSEMIQRAIDTFKYVNLCAREYEIDKEILIKGSFALHGASIPDFYGSYGSKPIDYSQTILRGKAENIIKISGYYNGKYNVCSFDIENVSFAGDSKRMINGIYITTAGGPSRPCVINNCNFKYLNKAVCVDISKSSLTTGAILTISNNNINQCNFALFGTGVSAFIDLSVINNNIEQNMSGGIYLNDESSERVHGGYCLIQNNNLEGQPYPIYIKSSGYIDIIGNYFESSYQRELVVKGTGYTKVNIRSCSYNFNKGESSIKITASYCTLKIEDMKQLDVAGVLNLSHVNLIDSDINFLSMDTVALSPAFCHYDSSLSVNSPMSIDFNYVRDNRCCLLVPSAGSKIVRNPTVLSSGEYRLILSYDTNQTVDSAAGNLGVVIKNGSASVLSTTFPSNSITGRKVAVVDFILKKSASASALSVTIANRNNVQKIYVYAVGLYARHMHVAKPSDTKAYSFKTRPQLDANDAGENYFDLSVQKQLYWTGQSWVDATGKKL